MINETSKLPPPIIAVLFFSLFGITSTNGADQPADICQQFATLLGTRSGLAPYALEAMVDDRGISLIPNIDIDGDNLNDEVRWSCPDAAGSVPVDSCEMRAILSASKKTVEFKRPRFFLIRFYGVVYIVSSTELKRQEEAGKSDIYRLSESGAKLVCKQL
jgi:hypothetical protein